MNIHRLTASGYPSVYESFPDRLSCLEMVIKANIKTEKKPTKSEFILGIVGATACTDSTFYPTSNISASKIRFVIKTG